jgi:hypothetical protein
MNCQEQLQLSSWYTIPTFLGHNIQMLLFQIDKLYMHSIGLEPMISPAISFLWEEEVPVELYHISPYKC